MGVLGVLPGMIGTIMANEALKIILKIGEILSGKLFVLDALTMQTQIISFEKNLTNSKIEKLIDYELFCSANSKLLAKEISATEVKTMLANKEDFQLIDVREKLEYIFSNIKGENIPLGSIEKNIDKISRTKKVVIHCKSGMRSRSAIGLLEKKYGFKNLYNLTGGIEAMK
jgi:adenylyltransferase/sulfurtransferase